MVFIVLVKVFVYCIESFRVFVVGKVDCCLFDKIGIIMSDCFVVEGVLSDLIKGVLFK